MRGTLRWARADLRARRGQALLTVAVVAGVVAALFLATMLLQGTINPWQQLFARTRGADVLIYFADGTDTSELRCGRGQAVGQPYRARLGHPRAGRARSPVELRAMTPGRPRCPRRWSSRAAGCAPAAGRRGRRGLVRRRRARGSASRSSVDGVDGTTVPMRVVGIADTADQGFYPQWTPGLIWVLPGLLAKVEPVASETTEVVGLRLADPSAAGIGQVVQDVYNAYNGRQRPSETRRSSRSPPGSRSDSMASNDRLLGAAARAVRDHRADRRALRDRQRHGRPGAGAAAGHRDAQGARVHPGPGGADAARRADRARRRRHRARPGRRAARDRRRRSSARRTASPVALAPLPATWMALSAAGTVLTVAVATVVPAWRAGRVSPVAAVAAEPAARPPVPAGPHRPARPAARPARPRRPRLLHPAAVRRAHHRRGGHPHGHDHDRADLLDHPRRVHQRPGPDRPGRPPSPSTPAASIDAEQTQARSPATTR